MRISLFRTSKMISRIIHINAMADMVKHINVLKKGTEEEEGFTGSYSDCWSVILTNMSHILRLISHA